MSRTVRRIHHHHGRMPLGPGLNGRYWCRLRRAALATMVALTVFVVSALAASDALWGVYPAQGQDTLAVYAIVRQIPPPPPHVSVPPQWREGTLAEVLVTAERSGATTMARRQAGAAPCLYCTAQHFFVLPEQLPTGSYQDIDALRHPPGFVTYIHVKEKEYSLRRIRVRQTATGLRLERAELMQTGFLPPLFKGRLRFRFDAPLTPGSHSQEIVDTALADRAELERHFQ